MRVRRILITTTAFMAGLSLAIAAPADAHNRGPNPAQTAAVLTTAVSSPYNLEVRKGRVLVADSDLDGSIGRVNADGTVTPVVSPAKGISGLAMSRDGKFLAYSYMIGAGPPFRIIDGGLVINGPGGFTAKADTFAYERAINPDHGVLYGIPNANQCVIEELMKLNVPAYFNGRDDSRPDSVAAYGKDFIVADAVGNTLLRSSKPTPDASRC